MNTKYSRSQYYHLSIKYDASDPSNGVDTNTKIAIDMIAGVLYQMADGLDKPSITYMTSCLMLDDSLMPRFLHK